jgi:hypothetical protein
MSNKTLPAAALRELEFRSGRREAASQHFRCALGLARSPMKRRFYERRIAACIEADGASDRYPASARPQG